MNYGHMRSIAFARDGSASAKAPRKADERNHPATAVGRG
jgi:hypothetical protein